MATESVTIPAKAIPEIRKMLAIGMSACGEIDRLHDIQAGDRMAGKEWPEDQRPIAPCGHNPLGDFASALMWLDCAEPVAEEGVDHV